MSYIWPRGFELATNYHCSHTSKFSIGKFLKNVQNCAHRKINDNLLVDSGLCLELHQWVTQSTREKEFWFFSSFALKLQLKQGEAGQFYSDPWRQVIWRNTTMWWFLTSWCQELSDGILHEWFHGDNLQLYYTLSVPQLIVQTAMSVASLPIGQLIHKSKKLTKNDL